MQSPELALGLWKAAGSPMVTGDVGGLVWQSVQASCGDFSGFCGFEVWWQTSHFPATLVCDACGNFTAPIVAPFRTMGADGASCEKAMPQTVISMKKPVSAAIVLLRFTTPPGSQERETLHRIKP